MQEVCPLSVVLSKFFFNITAFNLVLSVTVKYVYCIQVIHCMKVYEVFTLCT